MSDTNSHGQNDRPKMWPPDLREVRDIEAIADALEEHDAVEEHRLDPDSAGHIRHIWVWIGGETASTTAISDIYREYDLDSGWASIHPGGGLSVSVEAARPTGVTDA